MHLAIVSPYPPSITGVGQYGYHISRMLAQSGIFHRVTVLAGAANGHKLPQAATTLRVNYPWRLDHLNAGWAIASHLRQINPDIVWFNLGVSAFGRSPLANLSGFLGSALGRFMGLPTVVTLHELIELTDLRALHAPGGKFALLGARLLTSIATRADVVCLTLRHYVDWLSAQHQDLQCIHIPIGAYHTSHPLPESNNQELLFFSTLAPFKGIEILLEAFRLLSSIYPDLQLTVAGAEHRRFPGYVNMLRQKFASISNVRWLRQVPEDNVQELFEHAQIVILPYTASTGSSSVLYQAAMWGRPVVASDLPEIRSAVTESRLQVKFFQTGSIENLASAIRSMLNGPSLRKDQIMHNCQAIERVRPDETCRLYLQAFNLALERHRSSKRIAIPTAMRESVDAA